MKAGLLKRHLIHHGRFYAGAAAAAAVYGLAPVALNAEACVLAAADAFFAVYLVLLLVFAWQSTPASTKQRATLEDDGIVLIALLTAATVGVSVWAIFELIVTKAELGGFAIVLAILAVPLGWAFVHANVAPHYARLYYRGTKGDAALPGLQFPGGAAPDVSDFLYFSFVIGMTAQTSDVQIASRAIRRLALMHGVVSFFYNTVIVALAVNVAVQLAS